MLYLNRATLIGNATKDPEIRNLDNGDLLSTFNVATNYTYIKDGKTHEQAEFHSIVAFGKVAEVVAKHVKKGSKVFVEGRLQTKGWTDQNGVERKKTDIMLNSLIVLTGKENIEDLY